MSETKILPSTGVGNQFLIRKIALLVMSFMFLPITSIAAQRNIIYRSISSVTPRLMFIKAAIDNVLTINLMTGMVAVKSADKIEKNNKKNDLAQNYLIVVSIFSVLLLSLLSGCVFYLRRLKIRNRTLVKQMNDYDNLIQERDAKEAELQRIPCILNKEDTSNFNSDELYVHLRVLMKNPDVYTDCNLSRKSLSEKLGTNEKYLYETIKEYFGMTFSEYIANLRLNHARQLLSDVSEKYTIEEVAIVSGFGSRNTFHRLFRERYGLTPDEFRRMATS